MLVGVYLQLFFIVIDDVFILFNSFRHNCNITLHVRCDVNPGISGMVSKKRPLSLLESASLNTCWRHDSNNKLGPG